MGDEGYRHKPQRALRHYARLLGPTGATAGRVAIERDLAARLERVRTVVRSRRARTERMRALVVGPGGKMSWQERRAPAAPGPLGATVRPIAIATCDLDRPMMLGATPFPLPMQFGHECVAEVLAVGDDVRTLQPGQRVVVPFQINCGTCPACRAGRTGNCTNVPPASMYGFGLAGGLWGGAMADQLGVPYADAMLVPLPDGLDPVAVASVADNVSDGYRHIAPYLPTLLDEDRDVQVLIVGSVHARSIFTNSVGLYAAQVALALGARRVALVDARPAVRARAEALGVDAVAPGDVSDIGPARLSVDVGGFARGFDLALARTAPDGIVSCAGGVHRTVRIPLLRTFGRNATVHIGRSHVRSLIPDVLSLITDGRIRPGDVTTQVARLDDAVDALREHCRDDAIKTVLTA